MAFGEGDEHVEARRPGTDHLGLYLEPGKFELLGRGVLEDERDLEERMM
ncbi:hypothetical protein IHE61_28125 [Streptomyces sp. GKU 257-1]|nr:hypothetical protein [Streptomyces sp. GKU 257-1]